MPRKQRQQKPLPPDVPIRSRNDLPSLPSDCSLDVYYAEQIITELGTVGELVETYHSGLVFQVQGKHLPKDLPSEFTVQWYAFDFPFGAFLPQIVSNGNSDTTTTHKLVWNNTACAHYTAGVDETRWTKGETLVGRITGDTFNKFGSWTIDYCEERAGYQAFEVWDRAQLVPGVTVRWAESNTCSSFTEAALTKLYEMGADFQLSVQLLRRSYVPLISKTKPTVVNMDDEIEAQKVRDFYSKIEEAVVSQGMTTSEFIRFLADKLDFFYVYDSLTDVYLRVALSRPYFALAQLYQPMNLPWQMLDLEGDGVADDQPGEFAEEDASFLAEIGYAMEGSVDLLKRRLPTVVKQKLGPKILPIAAAAGLLPVVALSVLVFLFTDATSGIQIDASFVSGVLVGLAGGLVTSKIIFGRTS